MNCRKIYRLLTLLILSFPITASFGQASSDALHDEEREKHFTLVVLPIFQQRCVACHGNDPADIKGDFDISSMEGIMNGGESGTAAIERGNSKHSLMMEAIRWDGLEMPPKENDRLTKAEIAAISDWIDEGAVWPDSEKQKSILSMNSEKGEAFGKAILTSGGLSQDWDNRRYKAADVWAFEPIVKSEVPVTGVEFETEIDAFVDSKIAKANLTPTGIASPAVLVRRAYYDLLGLPPSIEETESFVRAYEKDPTDSWNQLIDKLLASPHYGERWGQHWLDVVRYADTSGFSNDFERSNAWRYRDYVIRSFNEDLPYDQFIIQQIAGDELASEESESHDIASRFTMPEGRVSTGFLRMGPWEHTAMTPEKVSRQIYLDDLTNAVGETFLSTPLKCCKCHDHKFDPIPTRDYYRVYAAFSTTQPAEMKAEFLDKENRTGFLEQKLHVETMLDHATTKMNGLYAKRETAAKNWFKEQGREADYAPFNQRRKESFVGEKPRRFIGLSIAEEGELKVREQDVRIWTRRMERFQPLAQSVYNGGDYLHPSQKLREPTNNFQRSKVQPIVNSKILDGGSVYSPSIEVTPGVLSAIGLSAGPTATEKDPYALSESVNGRRLGLARWIADSQNSLAVRSIVNRVWSLHFGKGIAGNPNNLGVSGKAPTHPLLLEHLSAEFVANGSSLKWLNKEIMLSKAYRRASSHPNYANVNRLDPNNQLLTHFTPRRLTAEELRDTMLVLSDEINLKIGGLSIRPEINLEVALSPRMIQFSLAPGYQPDSTPNERNRRSVYIHRIRGMSDPLLEVFDKPNSSESCEMRDSASVTPQVFTLLNSDVVTKRSIAMALRLQGENESVEGRIELGYQRALAKTPSKAMIQRLVSHYQQMVTYHRDHPPEEDILPTKITRRLVEEFSGDAFEYEERLDVYENYWPDKQASDVDAETRALADVCLLFLNSNEFMFVY
ncbi:PSD1 and planctomycete cytochrome C domain-containing protein [Mariniblastus sp.]|nr:PSD1 and planctomycete cytochrome C domain-containing protein [Mariniblastus sp.]